MDQLWVPILTHYSDGRVDAERTAAQMRSIRSNVKSILVAGSTGDGWELGDAAFRDLLAMLQDRRTFTAEITVMVGVLRDTTQSVLSRIELLKQFFDSADVVVTFAGITVCPPVDGSADQATILRHYQSVLDVSPWPISVYQLPQVTGNRIQPETLARLAQDPKVVMFKDSSGEDLVALSNADFGDVVLVRGAEGRYIDHLTPTGRYHGWLLSTGNVFSPTLRDILNQQRAGYLQAAHDMSRRLTNCIEALFARAEEVPFGNAFSNANRAADHILAFGERWRSSSAPETISGNRLPIELLGAAERIIGELYGVPAQGYLETRL
jgi:4-hydroxy-tetrahydrodipicolinate synthase